MRMSSRNLASGNGGAVLLPLSWSGPIPVVEPLLLQEGRSDASAAADPGSKALLGPNNCLYGRHLNIKRKKLCRVGEWGVMKPWFSVLAIISGTAVRVLYKSSL